MRRLACRSCQCGEGRWDGSLGYKVRVDLRLQDFLGFGWPTSYPQISYYEYAYMFGIAYERPGGVSGQQMEIVAIDIHRVSVITFHLDCDPWVKCRLICMIKRKEQEVEPRKSGICTAAMS